VAKLVERLMRRPRKKYGKSAMRLLEQSVHLLRLAPLELLPVYYIGSLPFMLGLLYFWSDMSRSADAADHVHAASLAMALLFVWMKTWQAIFSARVMSRLGRQPPFLWSLSRLATIAATQSLIQASGFVVLPLALLMTIPFGWCTAFYQNVAVLGAIESDGVRRLCREAYHHAGRWPYQNHKILAVMFLFAMVVFVNLATALYLLPYGVKSVLGIETIFTLHRFSLLNTTFILTVVSLTYLFVDPIVKTVYALRCFDGFAMASGDDIRTELKKIVAGKQAITLVFIGILIAPPVPGGLYRSAAGEHFDLPFAIVEDIIPRDSGPTVFQ